MENKTKCHCGHTIYCDCPSLEDDKEVTLEEVAHSMLCDYGIKSMGESINVLQVKTLMVKIAKWQQEQNKNLYSEEEVRKMFSGYNEVIAHRDTEEWLPWIDKQFKKK